MHGFFKLIQILILEVYFHRVGAKAIEVYVYDSYKRNMVLVQHKRE